MASGNFFEGDPQGTARLKNGLRETGQRHDVGDRPPKCLKDHDMFGEHGQLVAYHVLRVTSFTRSLRFSLLFKVCFRRRSKGTKRFFEKLKNESFWQARGALRTKRRHAQDTGERECCSRLARRPHKTGSKHERSQTVPCNIHPNTRKRAPGRAPHLLGGSALLVVEMPLREPAIPQIPRIVVNSDAATIAAAAAAVSSRFSAGPWLRRPDDTPAERSSPAALPETTE